MILGGMARRVGSGRDLRHVHDTVDPCLLRSLSKLGGRLNDAGTNGIAKVGSTRPLKGGAHRIEVEEVTKHDLDPFFLKAL
jgi:hypothetical protein